MPDLHGRFRFPGVLAPKACEYTASHGIAPGLAVLTMAPQANFEAAAGTLELLDGVNTISLFGCKVDRHTIARDGGGRVWKVAVLDRRWKWRWGGVNGAYNLRDNQGVLISRTEATPQQLATILLTEMGEVGFDVSRLPNDMRPTVEWARDVPAMALAELVESLGCRVVFDVLTNTVQIHRVGVGAELPTLGVVDDTLAIDLPERPDRIACVFAPTEWQVLLNLEAVGRDTDGSYKPIQDLSYRPGAGWHETLPPSFYHADLNAYSIFSEEVVRLARDTVYRCYRVSLRDVSGTGNVFLPGFGRIDRLDQILPLLTNLVEVAADQDGNDQRIGAEVYGKFYDGRLAVTAEDGTVIGKKYTGSFSFIADKGIVVFSEYVYQWLPAATAAAVAATGGINSNISGGYSAANNVGAARSRSSAAELKLLTTVNVKHATAGAYIRYERERSMLGQQFGTPTQFVRRDELAYQIICTYDDKTTSKNNIDGITDNLANIELEGDLAIAGAAVQYEIGVPQSRTYAGLLRVPLDGAIQQVSWSVGPSGATTQVSRNSEHEYRLPSYQQRLQAQRTAAALDRAERKAIEAAQEKKRAKDKSE